jgi:hypothetical protein
MANAKIIGIHDGKHIETDTSVRPLPMPIIKLRDETKEQIKNLLRQLFDNADDALFAMSDKAGTNGEQSIYLDAMRELRLQKKFIANAFLQQVVHSFNNVMYIQNEPHDRVSTSDFDNLSLLKNEELEINVAIEGMTSRLRSNALNMLNDLQLRFEAVLGMPELDISRLPASPEVLCEAFESASAELDVHLKARLVIFKLFEKYVLNHMNEVYQHANHLLIQSGILPDLKRHKAGKPATSSRQSAASQTTEPNAVRMTDMPSSGAATQGYDQSVPVLGKEQCLTESQFESIRHLMHSKGLSNLRDTETYGSNVVYLNQDQLLSTLTQQQSVGFEQYDRAGTELIIDFRDLISRAYSKDKSDKEMAVNYSAVDNDIINLVSMLFDFILDDKQLQSGMKALIARLQIPILKVAILDKTFFDRGGHPARKLLNEIASAALGWNEKNSGSSDRLKEKIESVVERVLNEFSENLQLFEELLLDFTQFMDLESRRGQLIEQRTKDTEKGKAATELARKVSEAMIHAVIHAGEFNGQTIPDCVQSLLTEGWTRVMMLDYLKLGEESSEWKGHQRFIYDLLWTVCPNQDGSEARGKLLQLIPTVMRRLQQGLKDAGFDELRLDGLLSALEKQHIVVLQRLHKQALAEQEAVKAAQVQKLSLEDKIINQSEVVAEQQQDQSEAFRQTLDVEDDFKAFQEKLSTKEIYDVLNKHEAAVNPDAAKSLPDSVSAEDGSVSVLDESDPFMQQVNRLAVGGWFEFNHSGQPERAKLAAYIKINGHYIFVNRSGVKVAEKTRLELAGEMKAGLIQVLNDGLLFDRALESVISHLRA